MSRDMVIENRAALREALGRFRTQLERLEADLDDPEELLAAAHEGKRTRDSLPVVRRSLLPLRHDLVVVLSDRPNQIGAVTQALGAEGGQHQGHRGARHP